MATRAAVPAPLAQLPNALTLGRLVLIPVFVAFMVQAGDAHRWPAGTIFAIPGATDQIHGLPPPPLPLQFPVREDAPPPSAPP